MEDSTYKHPLKEKEVSKNEKRILMLVADILTHNRKEDCNYEKVWDLEDAIEREEHYADKQKEL